MAAAPVTNAIGYSKHLNHSYDAVILVYDYTGNVVKTHQHKTSSKNILSLVLSTNGSAYGSRTARTFRSASLTNSAGVAQKHAKNTKLVRNCQERSSTGIATVREGPLVIKAGSVPIKIYHARSRGYDSFTVAYYTAGRRKRETFSELDRAKDRANEIRCAIFNDRLAVLQLDNADRDAYVRALILLRPFGVPLHNAIEEYAAARTLLNGEPLLRAVQEHVGRLRTLIDKPVREAVEEMIALKRNANLSKRYLETLRARLNRFADDFQTNIGNVTSRTIEDWLARLKLSPRGSNNIREAVVTLFKFAQRRGYLQKGQPTEADDVPKIKERGGKIGILSPAQLALLMKKAPAEFRLYYALGAFSGMRSAEILRLDWSEVNLDRGHITVAAEKAKTATRRLVPIQPNLMHWLALYRGRSGPVFVSVRIVSYAIRFAKSNGIAWPVNALRHSYATYRLAAIADTARVAMEMGTSFHKLMTNYRELADEHEAAAWFSIAPSRPKNVIGLVA